MPMSRTPFALLSTLLLALPACRPPPTPPEDPQPPDPVVTNDPIAGDPTDIENLEEIGDEQTDSAKIVSPGPAETEVQKGNDSTWPDPS
jgi:hypothetical protein